jgi:multidrug efflux system outer membrane protein
MIRVLVATTFAFVLAGCAAAPPSPQGPMALGVTIPRAWAGDRVHASASSVSDVDWWGRFESAELSELIDRARANSFDIAVAIANVNRARLFAQIAGASLLPEVAGSMSAARPSSYGAGLDASYEADFWGRNRALRDGALAELRATEFDRATVALTVTSEVARAYVNVLWLRQQHESVLQNIEVAERVMTVVESRRRHGAATELEVAQQGGLLVSLRRSLLSIDQDEKDSVASLATLLGAAPHELRIQAVRLDALERPTLDAGLPSELLVRRPDIASIEAQLRAADADIHVARAALFPSFTLSTGLGTGADHLLKIFDNPAYSLAASLSAPIFNAGRLNAGRQIALVQKEALLSSYRGAIVGAFADVEITLNAIETAERQHHLQTEEERLAQQVFTLAESRYRAGAEDLLTMLDAQRTLYAARDARLALHRERLQASIGLFRALGGGWTAR